MVLYNSCFFFSLYNYRCPQFGADGLMNKMRLSHSCLTEQLSSVKAATASAGGPAKTSHQSWNNSFINISFHGFSWWIYYESRRDTHRTVKQVSTTRLLRSFKIYLDSPYDPLCWRINQHLAQKSTSHAAPTLITGRPNGPTFAQGRGKGTGLHHQPGWVFAALCCAICAIYVAMWLWTKTFDHFFFQRW